MNPSSFSRRSALKILLGAGGLALTPSSLAWADTQEELDKAKKQYAEIEAQLEVIAEECEVLAGEQAETLGQIEDVSVQIEAASQEIEATQEEIERLTKELSKKRKRLGKRVSSAYKAGNDDILSVFLGSSSFEQLDSNIYYLDKLSAADKVLIDEVESAKTSREEKEEELERLKSELEVEKLQLEELNNKQREQLEEMRAKQTEVQDLLTNLDKEVQKLVAKRNDELAAQARQREEQERREREYQQALATGAAAGSMAGAVTGVITESGINGTQERIVNACKSTPTPGGGLCAMWVSMVFNSAGFQYFTGDACDMYSDWCTSSDRSKLRTGMIVAVSTHAGTAAGRIYGHIGIYVGNNTIMDNVGYIRIMSLQQWINDYSTTVPPRWGWLGGIELA